MQISKIKKIGLCDFVTHTHITYLSAYSRIHAFTHSRIHAFETPLVRWHVVRWQVDVKNDLGSGDVVRTLGGGGGDGGNRVINTGMSFSQSRVNTNGVRRKNVARHAGVFFAHFDATPKPAVLPNVAIP